MHESLGVELFHQRFVEIIPPGVHSPYISEIEIPLDIADKMTQKGKFVLKLFKGKSKVTNGNEQFGQLTLRNFEIKNKEKILVTFSWYFDWFLVASLQINGWIHTISSYSFDTNKISK